MKSQVPGFPVLGCLPVANIFFKDRTTLWVQCAGRLGWWGGYTTSKLPPLPFWKSLHYQLPLLAPISHLLKIWLFWPLGLTSVSALSFALALPSLPLYLAGAIMPHTPPPSPTSSRDAAHHQEHSGHVMGSPQNHCLPLGPLIPSTFTHSFRVQPTSIPLQDHQNGPYPSLFPSTPTLAPAPALPSHRQTLTSAQLSAAYAAPPPLNPTQPRLRPPANPSINQHISRGPFTPPSSVMP